MILRGLGGLGHGSFPGSQRTTTTNTPLPLRPVRERVGMAHFVKSPPGYSLFSNKAVTGSGGRFSALDFRRASHGRGNPLASNPKYPSSFPAATVISYYVNIRLDHEPTAGRLEAIGVTARIGAMKRAK